MTALKSFTDIPQSKKLAEILPLESADMQYISFRHKDDTIKWIPQLGIPSRYDIPCWSLAALLEQFEDEAGLARDYGLWFCYDNRKSYCTEHYDNPIDACYEMIIKLQ